MNRILVFIFCFLGFQSFANEKPKYEYGKITMEELNMTHYAEDTTAVAVMLLDVADLEFTQNEEGRFLTRLSAKIKIKILKPEGLSYCDNMLPYYDRSNTAKEKIVDLAGTTYNLEGGKIVKNKLSKDHIVDEVYEDKMRVKKFTMPAAKVGSVIEYKYTVYSPFFFNLKNFSFQNDIPVLYTSYQVALPQYFDYHVQMHGYEKIIAKENYKTQDFRLGPNVVSAQVHEYVFTGNNIQAFKEEKHVWAAQQYVSHVSFELRRVEFPGNEPKFFSTTWDKIDKELIDSDFGKDLNRPGLFKDAFLPMPANLENAKKVLYYIRDKVRWNEKERFNPEDLKKSLSEGVASDSDMNFLLINALKTAGFNAYPVVLKSRSSGMLPFTHPSISAFSHVITGVVIGDEIYFTDASSKYGDWNILPQDLVVAQARKLELNNSQWFDLTQIVTHNTSVYSKYKFTDKGYEGNITENYRGNAAYEFRHSYFVDHKDKDEYVEKLGNQLQCSVENFKIQNEEKTDSDIRLNYTFTKPVPPDASHIYVTPLLITQYKDNPFREESRLLPINANYLSSYSQVVEIEIPDGYVVEELPKSANYSMDEKQSLSFTYQIAQIGNRITLRYQSRCNRLTFLPNEYPVIKEFFAQMMDKNSEPIVLRRVEE